MAAICGKLSHDKHVSELAINDALAAMELRGGSHRNIGLEKNFGMGITQNLSIQDGGFQKIEELDIWLACDGKIYNVETLAKEYSINPSNNLEILGKLYRNLGPHLFPLLEGSFALAIWDGRNRTAVLIRDHIGTKPLYYSVNQRGFAFSSEIIGLIPINDSDMSLNLQGLDSYLSFSYVVAPQTLFNTAKQVPPAWYSILSSDGSVKSQTYLSLPRETFDEDNMEDLFPELRNLLAETLDKQIKANNNPGFLLSGGVDTTALLGTAKTLSIDGLKTFTLGFPKGIKLDEREDARVIAEQFKTNHYEFEVDHTCIERLDLITRHIGSPLSEPPSIISHELFRQVGKHINAVLVADGGNEIFGGTYKYNQVMNFIANLKNPPSLFKKLITYFGHKSFYLIMDTPLDFIFQNMARQYFTKVGNQSTSENTRLNEEQFNETSRYYAGIVTTWVTENKNRLYSEDYKEKLYSNDPIKFLTSYFNFKSGWDLPQQLPYVRTYTYIPFTVIPYLEFNAVSNDVFPVFPLLDRKMMEFMFRIPFEWVYGRGYRYFMEKSLSDIIVPSWIFRRPHKGFRAPVETWLKTQKWQEVVYDYLSQKTVKERGLFSPKFVQEILDKFYSGEKFLGKPQQGRAQPLSLTIWSLLALESWFQIFL